MICARAWPLPKISKVGCWTQKNVFCSLLEQMIYGSGADITKKPYFLPRTNMYGLSHTKAAIRN